MRNIVEARIVHLWIWILDCNIVSEIMSENQENKDTYMPINETAVHNILVTGGGYSQIREFFAGVDMHCMSNKTFLKHMKVLKAIDEAPLQSMLDAAEEEKAIAIRDGNVDSEGVTMCTVVADGAWCRRNYKTNYDSLSGVVNFTVDGFLQSEKLLDLKFNKLIGEKLDVCKMVDYTNFVLMLTGGDSSVHMKLFETMAYSPNLMVEKVECKKHVLRNYCHKLTDLTKNTKFPVTSRNLLKHQIPRFRTAVDKTIKYRAAGNEPLNTRLCMQKADVENPSLHIFGDHKHCDVYFCNGNKEGEINHAPELKSCGLLQEIMKIICVSVSRHVSSLIEDQNNNFPELFNSIVNKHSAGKRINYALRGQYKTCCSAAAVSLKNLGEYMRVVLETMMGGNSPGESTKFSLASCGLKKREISYRENDCVAIKLSPVEYREEEVTNCFKFWQGIATTSCKNLVHSILYCIFSKKGTQYGSAIEPVAKRKMAVKHGIVAMERGLFVDSEYPFLGATPDGLVDEDAIMEVKCPLSSDKYASPKEAVDKGQMSYCTIVNGKPLLRRQGQLHITGRKYCYFVVYTSRWMTYEVIGKDDEFWRDRMEQSLCRFYKECLLEELVSPQFSKRFIKADINDPIYIRRAQRKAKSATRK
ncbi:hypothetical protein PR048_018243, partial [Dryococelus australis]